MEFIVLVDSDLWWCTLARIVKVGSSHCPIVVDFSQSREEELVMENIGISIYLEIVILDLFSYLQSVSQ